MIDCDSQHHASRDVALEDKRDRLTFDGNRLKVDFRILPYLCLVFGLSLLDRSNISAAYIAGMGEDLELGIGVYLHNHRALSKTVLIIGPGNRYSIALLLFFVTYALFELPSNLVIRRIGAKWWLSFLITAWGVCVLGMGFVRSWVTLTVLRLLLGIFEAGCEYQLENNQPFALGPSLTDLLLSVPGSYLHHLGMVQDI